MAGRGFNAGYGFDSGPPPPGAGYGMPQQFPGAYYAPNYGGWPQPQQAMYPQAVMPPMYTGQPMPAGPPLDTSVPGAHLRNDTGGIGLPPGYTYLFPDNHVKVHVFRTTEKPWQMTVWGNDANAFSRYLVPSATTVKSLMQNLGCTNPEPDKNILYEVTEKGNGQWSSGMKIMGGNKDKVKKTLAEYGWDQSRTGFPGAPPVVWMWLTKEGA